MKKLVLGVLCIVLGFAANAAVTQVRINGLYYDLDDSTKTAEVANGDYETLTDVEIPASVTDGGESYAVTSIGMNAFEDCTSLKSVSAPSVTSIGDLAFLYCSALTSVYAPSVTSIESGAFGDCTSLTSLTVNSAMKTDWDSNKSGYGLDAAAPGFKVTFYTPPPVKVVPNPAANSTAKVYTNGVEVTGNPIVVLSNAWVDVVFTTEDNYCFADDHSTTRTNTVRATDDPTTVPGPEVVKIPSLSEEEMQQAEWKAETAVAVVSTAVKIGGTTHDKDEYENACKYYGITPKTEPTAEDFKAVPKDAQVVNEGEIAVTKESIEAAKAMTVQIVNGHIELGVSVLSNADITASSANWAPVKFTPDTQIGLSEDGTKLILPIPVAAQQGFMILQSGDAKVSEGGARVPVTGEPWYKPTVED